MYAKGGISPDYFIAMDTSGFTRNSALVYEKGSINSFAYNYYLQNLPALNAYKTPSDFIKGFVFTEENWEQFVKTAAKDSVNISAASPKEKTDLINRIRSSIARQVWRTEGFFEVLNTSDEGIKKALELLEKK